jgi:hypothetical protein
VAFQGAFAQFGPGKFNDLYKNMILPAGNDRLFFAGEALSLRHAWVEGALDSAWRAVADFCWGNQLSKQYESLVQEWGMDGELAASPQRLESGSKVPTNLPSNAPATGKPPTPEITIEQILAQSPFFLHLAANSL